MRFYRSDRIRTINVTSKDASTVSTKRKREEHAMHPPAPRITFKQSKIAPGTSSSNLHPTGPTLSKSNIPAPVPMLFPAQPAASASSTSLANSGGLKLKLKLSQQQQK
jgi:transcription initiation factor TFIID subunit 2